MIRNVALLLAALPVLSLAQGRAIFPNRPAAQREIAGEQAAAEISAIESRALEVLNATDFGVRCDGRTDDTKPATAAFDAAWSTGKTLQFPAGECLMGSIQLPAPSVISENQTLSFRGAGTGSWFDGRSPLRGGTVFRFTRTDGSDFMFANSSAFGNPTYQISDISIVGPDSWHGDGKGTVATTTKSGSGLKFTGKAAPRLLMRDVSIEGFYGNRSAALWVSRAEESSLYNVYVKNVNTCAHFSEAFNASTVVNFSCQTAMSDGIFITDSESLSWLGGVIQSNRATGLHIKGLVSSTFTSVHFENNNWSNSVGEGALKIEAVYSPKCDAPGACLSNQNLVFTGNVFNAPTDCVITLGGGPNGWANNNITFLHGYANGVTPPFMTLNENSNNWRIIGIVGVVSGKATIADSGTGSVMIVGNQIVALHDGVALSAIGDVVASGTLRVAGAGVFPSLKAKTGTRFVCVDAEGNLVSQILPCSGT